MCPKNYTIQNNKRRNKKDFVDYAKMYTQFI